MSGNVKIVLEREYAVKHIRGIVTKIIEKEMPDYKLNAMDITVAYPKEILDSWYEPNDTDEVIKSTYRVCFSSEHPFDEEEGDMQKIYHKPEEGKYDYSLEIEARLRVERSYYDECKGTILDECIVESFDVVEYYYDEEGYYEDPEELDAFLRRTSTKNVDNLLEISDEVLASLECKNSSADKYIYILDKDVNTKETIESAIENALNMYANKLGGVLGDCKVSLSSYTDIYGINVLDCGQYGIRLSNDLNRVCYLKFEEIYGIENASDKSIWELHLYDSWMLDQKSQLEWIRGISYISEVAPIIKEELLSMQKIG